MTGAEIAIVETQTQEKSIILFIRGDLSQTQDLKCRIDGKEVAVSIIEEKELPIKTLVLIDNSCSIAETDRIWVQDLIKELFADKQVQEQIEIATYGEQVQYFNQYSNQELFWQEVLEQIEYQDQDTFLTKSLYQVLQSQRPEEQVFQRILLITDGAEDSTYSYMEEIVELTATKPCPIHIIGCAQKDKKALKRSVIEYLAEKTEGNVHFTTDSSPSEVVQKLAMERNLTRLLVTPGEAGAVQEGHIRVQYEQQEMYQQLEAVVHMPILEEVRLPFCEGAALVTKAPQTKVKKEYSFGVMGVICLFMLLSGMGILLLLQRIRKSKKKVDYRRPETQEPADYADDRTYFMGGTNTGRGDTQWIWEEKYNQFHIVLREQAGKLQSYEASFDKPIIIGRKRKETAICIEQDSTVSGQHCELIPRNGRLFIKDLDSSNGTFVEGKRVLLETEVTSGMNLRLGRLELKLEIR